MNAILSRKKGRGRWLLLARRLSQLAVLLAFGFLFVQTDYHGSDQLRYAVNILFRLDPLLAITVSAATRTVVDLMLPALAVLALALLVGRAFCGWFCPLGSLLDCCRQGLNSDRLGRATLFPRFGLWLLVATVLLALSGFHLVGYVDPFSLLLRGLILAIYPAFHGLAETFFGYTYASMPEAVNVVTEPVYDWLKQAVLPGGRKYFDLVWLSLAMLAAIFALEIAQKRFFCRNVCPLGALFGLVGRFGLVHGRGGDEQCGKCRICATLCRMGAIDEERRIDMSRCNLCFECRAACPRQVIVFGSFRRQGQPYPVSISRRQFIGAAAVALLLPAVKKVEGHERWPDPRLIRPPGALPEAAFVSRCVRCGECLQVCIGNGLQPAVFEGGLDGMFTPKLAARTGYCEFNCTLCGQVCPTGAIGRLGLEEKQVWKIGNAWIDHNICLPHAKGIPCMVCEEHCPTPVKAIRFREAVAVNPAGEQVTVKQPYVADDLCIGCGICEFKCPLPGRSAIVVTSAGEQRDPARRLPGPEDFYAG